MSTRSNIAIQLEDDKFKVIYCHSDGYLTYNGAMLLKHYNTRDKIEELIKLGDLSCLAPQINPDPNKPHSFEYKNRQDDVCVAYGRDRNEENTQARILSKDEMFCNSWIEYFYVFTLDDKWKYYDYNFERLKDVKEDLAEILQKEDPTNGKWVKASDDLVKACKKKKHNSDEEM